MKTKLKLLVLTPFVIFGAGTGIGLSAKANTQDIELNSAITANTTFFFKNTYEINSTLKLAYPEVTLTLKDQVGTNNRVNQIFAGDALYDELSVVKSGAGYAEQEYINLKNEVVTRPLYDKNGLQVNYDEVYGNPFKTFASLSNAQINKYFDISIKDSNYILTANDLAYGALSKSLIYFYPELNFYLWDNDTYTAYVEDLKITILEDGTPFDMSFTRVKKDRFGAVQEPVTATFKSILKVETVKPVEGSLTEEQATTLKTKLDAFQAKVNEGNFTQTFKTFYEGQEVLTYSNYYALKGNVGSYCPPMMISDCPLYDANYGYTWVSLMLSSDGFIPYAFSPEKDYSGTMSQDVYPTMEEIIPHINEISTDFFSYKNGQYVFDIENFVYGDLYFCASILTAFMTSFDPAVSIVGLYLYNNSYAFQNLALSFDADNNLKGSLSYYVTGEYSAKTEFSFSNVGTTVLEEVESIAPAINFLLSM